SILSSWWKRKSRVRVERARKKKKGELHGCHRLDVIGDQKSWNRRSAKHQLLNEGDGAFYGPKIDISVSDALSKKFQCATLQLNFQLPDRLKLEFSAEDEAKIERPVMIHRVILGSVEHMFAILLEHYKGKWRFWLSPLQAIVCPVSGKSLSYALQLSNSEFYALFFDIFAYTY
ncbi:threonine--tRNA ligase, mitochondrial 1-like, partial [Vigna umbellata]|uniref:threonine--tRNA ligase, mitochondrial 1-like n=1 Tax=Vigna umbellata TaxID=87088 RepID=UPI001F5EE7A2